MNFDVNRGSLSLIILEGNPWCTNTCLRYSAAVPSAVISSLHGINTDAFVQSWSVIVSIESYPEDTGNLTMKSSVTVSNGMASGLG